MSAAAPTPEVPLTKREWRRLRALMRRPRKPTAALRAILVAAAVLLAPEWALAADRFWVGGTGNTNDTAHWSLLTGGVGGAAAPTSADNCIFDVASNATSYTVTVNATFTCLDATFAAPLAGNLTLAGSSAWDVYGSFTLYSGLVRTYTGAITFRATATGKTITLATTVMNSNIVFDGVGGGWTFQDAFNIGVGVFRLTSGAVATNGQTVTTGIVIMGDSGLTRSLTLGATTWTGGNYWSIANGTNMTLTANTSSIVLPSVGGAFFDGGGFAYNNVSMTGAITVGGLYSSNSYVNLTITGTASKLNTLGVEAGTTHTVSGTFTLNGNSATNRYLIRSFTVGTTATINAAVVTVTNADFRDITGAGAGSWNLSAITGGSGDCGGNTSITFTTGATQYWDGAGAVWSTTARWFLGSDGTGGAGRVPLCQDTARFDANSFSAGSQTVTSDMPRIGAVDWTGVTNTPAFAVTTAVDVYGSLTMVSGMTNSGTVAVGFLGRGAHTITSAGRTFAHAITFNGPAGTYTLQDAFTTSSTLTHTSGTLDTNGMSVTATTFTSSGSTRSIAGAGVFTITGSNTTVVSISTTNLSALSRVTYNLTYSGGTGTRTVNPGVSVATTASGNVNVTAGTDIIVFTASAVINNLDFTGFAGTLSASNAFNISGSLVLSTGMTVASGTSAITFNSVSAGNTITSNGRTIGRPLTFLGTNGAWALSDALTLESTRAITMDRSTFTSNSHNITAASFAATNTSFGRTVTLGTSTVTLTGTGTVWDVAATGMTFSGASSTIKLTDSSATAKTFSGGGLTYGTVWPVGGGSGTFDFVGSNTFGTFKCSAPPLSIRWTAATTQQIAAWDCRGTSGNLVTIGSITAASHTLNFTGSSRVCENFFSISRSTGTPASMWYAGPSSTDGGNNSGWVFGSCFRPFIVTLDN